MPSLMWPDKLIFLEQGHHQQATASDTFSAKISQCTSRHSETNDVHVDCFEKLLQLLQTSFTSRLFDDV
jgi:hypothetical protein